MRRALAPALLVAAALVAPVEPAAADSGRLRRLGELHEAHPEDSDLAWLWIVELEHAGENERALRELARFTESWPGRRPEASLHRGLTLYRLGRHEAALAALEDAAEQTSDPTREFYRGLCLRQLGQHREAVGALLVAAALEPELGPEARLLAALSELALDREPQASALLEQVMAEAPSSESAQHAALLLGGKRLAPDTVDRRLSLFASVGIEGDSNVTLEGKLTPSGVSTDEADLRAVWSASFSNRFFESERASATIGYRYAESTHLDLKEYDLAGHLGFASARFQAGARTQLRLDTFLRDDHLDGDRYQRSYSLRPSLLFAFGASAGFSRAYFEFERVNYHDSPIIESLVRDGTEYAVGLEHYLPLGRWPGTWLSASLRVDRVDTDASRDLLGFGGAYDKRGLEPAVRLTTPLPWSIEADIRASYGYDRYRHRNVIDGLFESGVGDAEARRDHIYATTVSLSRPLSRHTAMELRWQGRWQRSNLDTYQYDRQIVGLYLRVESN